ncbi:hypothetical protein BDV28DRAFT_157763 [Aspergillus coremiiformis]|uniref:C2H2 type master regulator of conidiophore development brlA n=1 Tax=Aspergillus coremiiformis TaxID=138285 RepID=A0A5N6Z5B2_9EURO|nr:hypothetical protein BDV28DRAFT_157763 [Aspergillus coremiiformis]
MLSNPHRNLQERHRQHRRQISTPSVLDAAKVPSLPAQAMHRYHAHRRGQSLDQRSLRVQRSQTVQDGTLSNTNATGLQRPQNFLGGVQQHQCVHAAQTAPMPIMPECQPFSNEDLQAQPNMGYMSPAFSKIETPGLESRPITLHLNLIQQQQLQQAQLLDNSAWDFYPQDNLTAALPHQTSAMPADMRRLSMQSDASPAQRPHTPKLTQYLPITPATTPFKKTVNLAQYGGDMQPTPTKEQRLSVPGSTQPSYMQRAKSLQGVAGTTFSQPKMDMPSPPNTASFEVDSFNVFDCQQGSSIEVPKSESFSSNHSSSSPATSSFNSSPELASMPHLQVSSKAQKVPIYPATPSRVIPKKTPSAPSSAVSKPKLSPRVASIDSLNLDARVHASIKETGVTIDEIASYIDGPDPEDGKWVCLHPGCERRFGRKENIKSHVQTHLGDRQYKCDHCDKCFVRGHDLKRHAKIHTGDKPYECLCGNVFARHDALTRHRQRGMCIGGYKGIVRKNTKRGRPRKHRPEMDERQDKASRTRQRIAEKTSFDSGSDTSRNSPPSEVFENMSLHGSSPVGEMPMFGNMNYSLPPEVLTFTPPASPGGSMRNKLSPAHSQRSITPSTEDEMPPLSPSKRPLEKIIEESGLPLISDSEACPYTNASDSTTRTLSSPHAMPILTDSSNGSDLDIFINQDPSASFGKHEFPGLTDPDMAAFPDYVNGPAFDNGMDLFPGKGFSTGSSIGDDFFSFQFQMDEQPSDVMTREFFLE